MTDIEKMDIETEEDKRKRIPCKVFAYLLLFIPISFVLGYFFLSIYTHFKYVNILANIKSKGEPSSLSDYEFPEIPNEYNGAIYVKSALDHVYIETDDFLDAYESQYGWASFDSDFKVKHLKESPEKLQMIKNWITANKLTLELVKKATQCPKSDFRYDYKNLFAWDECIFCLHHDWHMMQLLQYIAYVSIAENDKTKAIDELIQLIDYGLLWKNELTWANHSNIKHVFDLSLETLREIVDSFNLTVDEINELNSNLQKIYRALDIKKVLKQERCFYLDYYSIVEADPMYLFEFECSSQYEWLPENAVKLDMLKTIEILGQLIEMSEKTYPEIEDELSELIIDTRETTISWEFTEDNNMIKVFRGYFDDIALYRIVQATLAIKKFEIINKRIPEKLDELIDLGLIDTMPKSPFTNQQLIYEIENGNYRLFCPGSNGAYFKSVCGCGEWDTSPRDDIEWKYED